MNDTEDGSCWRLLPSLIYELSGVRTPVRYQDESLYQHAAGCVNWTQIVRETVPCPPPTNLCLFWKAANNTNLDVQEVELVTQVCNIPNRDDCSSPPLVVSGSSLDCDGCSSNSTLNPMTIAANNTNIDTQQVELVTKACNLTNGDDCRSPPLVVSGGSTDCDGCSSNSTPNPMTIAVNNTNINIQQVELVTKACNLTNGDDCSSPPLVVSGSSLDCDGCSSNSTLNPMTIAANNTNIDTKQVELVTKACNLTNGDDCSSPPLVVSGSSTDCDGWCVNSTSTPIIIGCVVGGLIVVIALCIAIAVWLQRKGKLAKWCAWCSGVCICCDKVLIQKKGLNRSESRSPALDDGGDQEEKDTCVQSSAHDNEAFYLHPKSIKLEFINNEIEEEETEYEQVEMEDKSEGVNVTNALDNTSICHVEEYIGVDKPTTTTLADVVTIATEQAYVNVPPSYC